MYSLCVLRVDPLSLELSEACQFPVDLHHTSLASATTFFGGNLLPVACFGAKFHGAPSARISAFHAGSRLSPGLLCTVPCPFSRRGCESPYYKLLHPCRLPWLRPTVHPATSVSRSQVELAGCTPNVLSPGCLYRKNSTPRLCGAPLCGQSLCLCLPSAA